MWSQGLQWPRGDHPPTSSHTCTLWRALASDPDLPAQVLGLLLQKMSKDVPFKESRAFLLSSSPDRVATLLPLAVSGVRPTVPSTLVGGPPKHLAADCALGPSLVKACRCVGPQGRPCCFIRGKQINPAWQGSQQ